MKDIGMVDDGATPIDVEEPQPHSIWLLAQAQMQSGLENDIAGLSARFGCPLFSPHVTLVGDLQGAPHQTLQICKQELEGFAPVCAKVTGLARSDAYFMSAFLDLEFPSNWVAVQESLCAALGGAQTENFRPHISLAYGLAQGVSQKAHLDDITTARTGNQIILDKVTAVSSARSIPIQFWRPLLTLQLGT